MLGRFLPLAVTLFCTAAPLPESKQVQPPNLVGNWAITEFYFSGVKQPQEACDEMEIEINNEPELSFITKLMGRNSEARYRIKIDDRKYPHELELIDSKTTMTLAIYKADKDGVVIVFGKNYKDRPLDFTPRQGDSRMKYTLKRIDKR